MSEIKIFQNPAFGQIRTMVWTDTYLVWTEQGKEFIHQLVKYERNI